MAIEWLMDQFGMIGIAMIGFAIMVALAWYIKKDFKE